MKRCPHCDKQIRVNINFEIEASFVDEDADGFDWKERLEPHEITIVETAMSTGIYKAYASAVERSAPNQETPPKATPAGFLRFLRLAVPKIVPRWALDQFIREFRPAQVQVMASNGVGMVLADNSVRWFFPSCLTMGQQIKDLTGKKKGRLDADPEQFNTWIRTRNGYVFGPGAMLSALAGARPGDLALRGM